MQIHHKFPISLERNSSNLHGLKDNFCDSIFSLSWTFFGVQPFDVQNFLETVPGSSSQDSCFTPFGQWRTSPRWLFSEVGTWLTSKSLSVIDFLVQPFYSPCWDPHVQVAPFGTTCKGGVGRFAEDRRPFLALRDVTRRRRGTVGGWRFWLAPGKWQNGHRGSRGHTAPPETRTEVEKTGLTMSSINPGNSAILCPLFFWMVSFCDPEVTFWLLGRPLLLL